MILFYSALNQLYYETIRKPGFMWVMWHNLCQSCKRVGLAGLSTCDNYTLAHGLQTVSFGCSWWNGTVIYWNVSVQRYIFLHIPVSESHNFNIFKTSICFYVKLYLHPISLYSARLNICENPVIIYFFIKDAWLTFFLVRQNETLGSMFSLLFSKEVNGGESTLKTSDAGCGMCRGDFICFSNQRLKEEQ